MTKAARHGSGCNSRKDASTSRARSVSATEGHTTSRWTPSYILLTFSLGIDSLSLTTWLFNRLATVLLIITKPINIYKLELYLRHMNVMMAEYGLNEHKTTQ